MCGIFCCISKTGEEHRCLENILKRLLTNRGPDTNGIKEIGEMIFGGFVLWQQGNEICVQPVESETHLLLLSGDIYNLPSPILNKISDSKWIFEQLSNCQSELELINLFKTIEGPFSLIFYDKINKTLYFGRDSLGRNSLLIENNHEHFRLLSSSHIANTQNNTLELPPLGMYKINKGDVNNLYVFPWRSPDNDFFNHKEQLEKFCKLLLHIQCSIEPDWLLEPVKNKKYNFNFYDMINTKISPEELYNILLNTEEVFSAINEFSRLLEKSVKQRVQYTTNFCTSCLEYKMPCTHSKVAILFSGGIDCTVLAILSDKFVNKSDSIDLINVAFERSSSDDWDVPDRISAKLSYTTLKYICPKRIWNFMEVNVSKQELHELLSNHIKHLIYPLNTVLDESIGCALWFASRAITLKDNMFWKSSARVAIVGSGADELFGGYVRHRNAYSRYSGTEAEKQQNLLRELEIDWNRISSRNLARDDRVISDNGRTPRAPFIEEHLVNFVRSLKPYQRCCFLLADGIGDKLFLRLYGYKLGLTSSAFLKKRAIQFGSRIANKKQNARDRSIYL